MSSKQLKSILNSLPSATAEGEKKSIEPANNYLIYNNTKNSRYIEEQERIVAVIPKSLKDDIRYYIKSNKGMTERIVILQALKAIGFNISEDLLIDKRTTR